MTKQRVKKKHYRIVREALEAGKVVPRFQLMRVFKYWDDFSHMRYIKVFRPWWYEQLVTKDRKIDFKEAHTNHFNETIDLFKKETGVDMILFGEELKRQRKPSRNRKSKPRKEKAPAPIRKLKNPVQFRIKVSQTEYRTVTGEKVFEQYGIPFYIFHAGKYECWCVTCGETGYKIAGSERYKKAIERAKKSIQSFGEEEYKKIAQRLGNIMDENLVERRQEHVEV